MEPYKRLRKRLRAFLGALALAGVLGLIVVRFTLGSLAAPLATLTPIGTHLPQRQDGGEVKSPAISSIDSRSPTCYRPAAGTAACYIQWNYLYVTAASGSYIVSMTVTIEDRMRAYHAGFFQSYIYIPEDMTAPGYKVACGGPVSEDVAAWGNTYTYKIRARDTTGLTATNYGTVACPADMIKLFVPLIQKQ